MASDGTLRWGQATDLHLVLLGGALLAWAGLLLGTQSPYGRYLDHESAVGSAQGGVWAIWVFVAGWTLMVFATLVPTTIPLLVAFQRVVRLRVRRRLLLVALVAGFLAVWAAFGYCAFVADGFVHAAVDRLPWLGARPYLISGGVLATAGMFQFTSLKQRCLTGCRSPHSLLFQHWGRARAPGRQAAWIGVVHGLSCLGCCWALMLLMFAFATGSLAWMAVFGVVMAVEKNARRGEKITRPLGAVLLASAAVVVAVGAFA